MDHQVPTIPGTKAPYDLAQQLRYEVSQLLERTSIHFPGAQPVSFAARHIEELQQRDYYVCEKSDGMRCLMYLTRETNGNEVVYLIDRKNDYYHVKDLHFPLPGSELEFHIGTMVDGELVIDNQENGERVMRYLVFDCLVLDHQSLIKRTLDKRLAYFREKVYIPYRDLYKKYPDEVQYLPFQLQFKDMHFGYGVEMMFRDVLPKLPHGNDGLIFTCRTSPYQFGTDNMILKWKDRRDNSIDFKMTMNFPKVTPDADDPNQEQYLDYTVKPEFCLHVHQGGDDYSHFAELIVDDAQWEKLKALNEPLEERIVECCLDDNKRWRLLRFRDDKRDANHSSTVTSVLQSIRDSVSKEDLIHASKSIREAWKRRQAAEEAKREAEAKKAVSR